MLNHPTLDKLLALKLTGMAKALSEQMALPESQALTFEERLGLLVDRELTARSDRRLTTRLRQAKLRLSASLEDIDYRHPRGLDKALLLRLASCQRVASIKPSCCAWLPVNGATIGTMCSSRARRVAGKPGSAVRWAPRPVVQGTPSCPCGCRACSRSSRLPRAMDGLRISWPHWPKPPYSFSMTGDLPPSVMQTAATSLNS